MAGAGLRSGLMRCLGREDALKEEEPGDAGESEEQTSNELRDSLQRESNMKDGRNIIVRLSSNGAHKRPR